MRGAELKDRCTLKQSSQFYCQNRVANAIVETSSQYNTAEQTKDLSIWSGYYLFSYASSSTLYPCERLNRSVVVSNRRSLELASLLK